MPVFYVYILRSQKTGRYYIGQTNNLEDRLLRHNEGRVLSTKSGSPWELVVYYTFSTRWEAMKMERKLKSIKSHRSLEKYILEH